jgi:hypothetical protein
VTSGAGFARSRAEDRVENEVRLDSLASGDVFEMTAPGVQPGPEDVFRIEMIRSKTILARNVLGSRLSFAHATSVRRATPELWARLEKERGARAEPGAVPREKPGEVA